MQKSKSNTSLISLVGIIDIVLLILLFISNAFAVLQNQAALQLLANILKNLNVERVVIVGSIFTTIIGLVINYNVLKVIFQLSLDAFDGEEILFIYLASSLLSFGVVYLTHYFFKLSGAMEPIFLNIIYGVFIFALPNLFMQQKAQKTETAMDSKLQLKLNLLLIAYGLINLAVVYFGSSAYD